MAAWDADCMFPALCAVQCTCANSTSRLLPSISPWAATLIKPAVIALPFIYQESIQNVLHWGCVALLCGCCCFRQEVSGTGH